MVEYENVGSEMSGIRVNEMELTQKLSKLARITKICEGQYVRLLKFTYRTCIGCDRLSRWNSPPKFKYVKAHLTLSFV